MSATANYSCPNCGGTLRERPDADGYECRKCGTDVDERVAQNADDIEAVANSGGPAAELAEYVLENGGL